MWLEHEDRRGGGSDIIYQIADKYIDIKYMDRELLY